MTFPNAALDAHNFLAGGGQMGARVRAFDWSRHPLGPPDGWPQSLRSAFSICLNAAFPIALYWGPDAILLYNDAWSPILGTKHPWAFGRPGREVWSEIWGVVGPLFERVVTTGEGSFQSDALLAMHRHGYTEECYFDYTFSPIRGEGGRVEGVFNAVTETTHRVIEKRRLRTLRDLAAGPSGVQSAAQSAERIIATLAHNPIDVPFAMLYVLAEDGASATLAGATPGAPLHLARSPYLLSGDAPEDAWPIAEAVRTRAAVIRDVRGLPGLPKGYWNEPPHQVIAQPVASAGQERPAAVLVAGVNPRRAIDDEHRTFFALAASQIASALADARAYEEERRRAEALAALDRAKTAFFSNVSHELRTPLTLMLGPLQDALSGAHGELPSAAASDLAVAHRNAQRLHKLVNALLDFSRIEAGRVEASYERTELGAFTSELASSFRSAVERVGMQLIVDCPPLDQPAYVDRGMWEKIVLNLVSNAFKYTLRGEIRVSLSAADGHAVLTVSDTGIGIPDGAMPRLFERFFRVENTQGRTHEGTGIGLALVNDLVKLHGGNVTAHSELGRGSAFTVSIPLGAAHLPRARVQSGTSAPTSVSALHYADEALSWIGDGVLPAEVDDLPLHAPSASPEPAAAATILLADDNRDMRGYIERLLSPRYRVIAVSDGQEALDAARRSPPDLVLTDVMMPRLDGFGLLAALRANPATADIPVIMLSARAGEESRVEGLNAGADDYLVKPFSAREVLARVDSHVKLARLRREARDDLQRLVDQRTAELEASHAKLRLSERMAALGTLSAGLGHDMGNLLVPIRIRLEELAKADLPPVHKKDVEAIQVSTEYLRKLAGGLRMLALDPTGGGIKRQHVDLKAWWEEAEPMFRSVLPRGVQLKPRFPDTPCCALGSKPALSQVVFNLVQNAGDALKGRPSGTITIWFEPSADTMRIGVSDDGPGMTPSVKARCMEPFFTTKPRDISTGLGLALVYGLVNEMDGSIALDSTPGVGTTFVISLPACDTVGVHEASAPATGRRAQVIVRDPRTRAIITSELTHLGFAVAAGADGDVQMTVVDDLARLNGGVRTGPVVLIGDLEPPVDGVIALGAKPGFVALRNAIHRAAAARVGGTGP